MYELILIGLVIICGFLTVSLYWVSRVLEQLMNSVVEAALRGSRL